MMPEGDAFAVAVMEKCLRKPPTLSLSLSRRASRTFRECANERGDGYALGSLENKKHCSRRMRSPSTAKRRPGGGRRYQSFKTHIRRTSKVTPELTVRMNGQINDNA